MRYFICKECGKKVAENKRLLIGCDWCEDCIDKESERSIREDEIGPPTNDGIPRLRSKPPRYMME